MKNKSESILFWEKAREYVDHYLPDIRKASHNTVSSYRTGLNQFIDYLEQQKNCGRKDISFSNFTRANINDYLGWLLNIKNLSPKTCNLRLASIHSLMEFASGEDDKIMPLYLNACSVKRLKVEFHTIEYFEKVQMRALLAAPKSSKKTERRNQMLLIMMYDTGARVQEIIDLKIDSLHVYSSVPYITIFGKGRKYRNIPLMEKTKAHLERYLREFHPNSQADVPLFFAITYGEKHRLSSDTIEKMLKRYGKVCEESGIEMPKNLHCHMIRKTRAMDLYQSDVPLTHIQQLLGHENISTTSGFYAFATLDTLARTLKSALDSPTDKKWNDKYVMAQIYRL